MSTPQKSIGSGFGAASTAGDVIKDIDLSNRVAIVTGGSSGIGLETTRTLVSAGARVIVPARDHHKAATALEGLDGVELYFARFSLRLSERLVLAFASQGE